MAERSPPSVYRPTRTFAAKVLVPCGAAAALTPYISSGGALALGMALALTCGNPYLPRIRRLVPLLLGVAITAIGAGMDLRIIGRAGLHGLGYTALGIALTLGCGLWLARRLRIAGDTGTLIAVGTAICGGSAIAAVAPVIEAKAHEVTVALGTVFMLNAAALILFPPVGHLLGLSQSQFGLWAALAIHDTSSVVGATLQYGPEAVGIGTTVKLARALWIMPVAFGFSLLRRRASGDTAAKPKRPWFIAGFLLTSALVTLVPALHDAGQLVDQAGKRLMVLTLFLIGAGLTPKTLRAVGIKPLVQGLILWLAASSISLAAIIAGWIA